MNYSKNEIYNKLSMLTSEKDDLTSTPILSLSDSDKICEWTTFLKFKYSWLFIINNQRKDDLSPLNIGRLVNLKGFSKRSCKLQ
jgi:hypothetical protein